MGGLQLNLRHVSCDLADPAQVWLAIAEVEDFLKEKAPSGRILLINNSGFGSYGCFPEPALEHHLEMLDVNVRAVLQLTGHFIPVLRERGGVVVTIASVAAFQPTAYMATYGATKTFLLHWSLALNEELRGSGASALAVCPGPTSTEFFRRAGLSVNSTPEFLGQTSMEVVEATFAALASGKAMVVSGWKNKVIAALVTKLPKVLAARLTAASLSRFRLKQVKP